VTEAFRHEARKLTAAEGVASLDRLHGRGPLADGVRAATRLKLWRVHVVSNCRGVGDVDFVVAALDRRDVRRVLREAVEGAGFDGDPLNAAATAAGMTPSLVPFHTSDVTVEPWKELSAFLVPVHRGAEVLT
jgi:hypothetical protein